MMRMFKRMAFWSLCSVVSSAAVWPAQASEPPDGTVQVRYSKYKPGGAYLRPSNETFVIDMDRYSGTLNRTLPGPSSLVILPPAGPQCTPGETPLGILSSTLAVLWTRQRC